jgi:hypothetical protein
MAVRQVERVGFAGGRSLQVECRRAAVAAATAVTASSVLLYRLIFTSGVAMRLPPTPATLIYPPLHPLALQNLIPLEDLCVRMDYLAGHEEDLYLHSQRI